MRRTTLLLGLILVGAALVLVACGGGTPTEEVVATPEVTEAPMAEVVIPFMEKWEASPHADATAEAFRHWDEEDPKEIPASCAKCHSESGYLDFLGADGSAAGTVDAAAQIGSVVSCVTCHNDATMAKTSVVFPSGVEVTGLGDESRCMECHQGRASTVQVNAAIEKAAVADEDTVMPEQGFINIHYFPAGATLYGTVAKGGYEYDGNAYDAKFRHTEGLDTCLGCHDTHSLEVKIESCTLCHEGVTTVDDLKNVRMAGSLADYDGDGDVAEGVYYEMDGLRTMLLTAMQAYSAEVAASPIAYSPDAYPYFFVDTNANGSVDGEEGTAANGYKSWTPRLLKAAYNYQLSVKDPGAFAHGGKYIMQLMYDAIESLNEKLGTPVDLSTASRIDPGHFAGSQMAFRDWDDTGEVPASCAKCHSATGLPEFIHNAGTTALTGTGSLLITGVVGQPASNGFLCSTCHDEANWPARYPVTTVPFPSGAKLTFSTEKDADGNLVPVDSNLCIECHQGRESTVSLDKYLAGKDPNTVDAKISFKNIHYFAAGATLFGDAAKGAYQYEGQTYLGQNTQHPLNQCTQCHGTHELDVKVTACVACHPGADSAEKLETIRGASSTADYDGDGDVTEGIYGEIDTMRSALYEAVKADAKKNGTPVVYSAAAYPYFFVDADENGEPDTTDAGAVRYNAWTPTLLRAAFNLQYAYKDPGAFAHNPKYVIQFLYDSIASLDKAAVAGMTRP